MAKQDKNNYILLHRKMLEWEWYDEPNTCRVFIHCLLKANWKPCKWHGVEIESGQFITSLQSLAVETSLSVRQVRTALDHLISTGEVTSKGQSKFRIITVNNWLSYQLGDKQNDKQPTSNRQATDKQPTTVIKGNKEISNNNVNTNLTNNTIPYFPDDEIMNGYFLEYVAYRKEKKNSLTDRSAKMAIKNLIEYATVNGSFDREVAKKIIDRSIANGWTGLFPLDEQKKPKQAGQKINTNIISRGGIDWAALEKEAYNN